MRVLILGATGRLGGLAVERALSAGHDVVALVRRPDRLPDRPALTVLEGDIQAPDAVDAAVRGVDAVLAAIGPRTNTPDDMRALELGMGNIVAAMERHRIERLVALSGAGIHVPGDRKPFVDRIMSHLVRHFARHVVDAKQREFEVFAASSLAWTALRPPLVTDGPARGYRLDLLLRPGARVTRADVGQALVDQVSDPAFVRRAPFVLPPSRQGSAPTDG